MSDKVNSIMQDCFGDRVNTYAEDFRKISEVGFCRSRRRGNFPHTPDTFSRYSMLTVIGTKKKKERTEDKVARDSLTYWISLFGAPDIISGWASGFTGRNPHNLLMVAYYFIDSYSWVSSKFRI